MPVRPDHAERISRANLALEGLSVGDAFGQRFFGPAEEVLPRIEARELPAGPWLYTDDTEMALALVEVLEATGEVEPGAYARALAARHAREPDRGYGAGARQVLTAIGDGLPWHLAAQSVFEGQGSKGNGAAMRVAPLGAYLADDLPALHRAALDSARVTHHHPDGQAGAVAVARAAAYAWLARNEPSRVAGQRLLAFALAGTPAGETAEGLRRALSLPAGSTAALAASALGTGREVLSADTVPFALWCAERHLGSYEGALWATVGGLGDRDTTCAIVGGVVALSANAVPAAWAARRERLRR